MPIARPSKHRSTGWARSEKITNNSSAQGRIDADNTDQAFGRGTRVKTQCDHAGSNASERTAVGGILERTPHAARRLHVRTCDEYLSAAPHSPILQVTTDGIDETIPSQANSGLSDPSQAPPRSPAEDDRTALIVHLILLPLHALG